MADERPLHERLLDLAVYVPIGLAASIVEELPALAEKGRQRLRGQFEIARMVGKFTVAEAQRRVGRPAPASRPSPAPAASPTAPPPAAPARPAAETVAAPPVVTEPVVTEPVVTEPVVTEPVVTEPAPARPATTARASKKATSGGTKAPRTATASVPAAGNGGRSGAAAPSAPPVARETPDASALPIPGYDTLAASQVVQRLGSLRPDELDAVRRYEVATRGRRTILHRIGQLTTSDGRATA